MYSSAFYKQKKEEFEALCDSLCLLSPMVEDCYSANLKSINYLENVVISGVEIEGGALTSSTYKTLTDFDVALFALIGECQAKITQYGEKYSEALYLESLDEDNEGANI